MKKLFLGVLACSLAFMACTKDQNSTEKAQDTKKYPIRFSANAFKKDVSELPDGARKTDLVQSGRDTAFVSRFTHLYYFAFNGQTKVSEIVQVKSEVGDAFGEISDSLTAAYHRFILVASDKPLNLQTTTAYASYLTLSSNAEGELSPHTNVYYRWDEISISGASAEPYPMTLSRCYSRLNVVIEDLPEIQNLNGEVRVKLLNLNDQLHFETRSASGGSKMVHLVYDGTKTFSAEVLPPSSSDYQLIIEAKNIYTGDVMYSKTISNLDFQTNQLVTYTGKLKSPPPGPVKHNWDFTVSVSDMYGMQRDLTF